MKKMLLFFVCACAFVSCSQDEVISIPENDNNIDTELRSLANAFTEANLTDLYEYAAYSGNKYIDFCYSTTKSDYISHDGRTYYYERKVARIFKEDGLYHGHERCFVKLALYYQPTSKIHRIWRSDENPPSRLVWE